jgi:hypothetical protein
MRLRILHDPGVVHQHVDTPAALHDLIDHSLDRRAVGHVHDIAIRLSTRGFHCVNGLVDTRLVDVADDDDSAFAAELERSGMADTAPRAGDDGYFALQPHGEYSLFCFDEIECCKRKQAAPEAQDKRFPTGSSILRN